MNNSFEENNYDTTIDALLSFINTLPKGKVKMIDIERYKTMMHTAAELKDILVEAGAEGELVIDIHDSSNAGSIEAELEELTVLNFGRILTQGETKEVLNNPEVIKAYLGE